MCCIDYHLLYPQSTRCLAATRSFSLSFRSRKNLIWSLSAGGRNAADLLHTTVTARRSRSPMSVIPIIHIYEFRKHHLLNLPTLHACRGKDREIVRERLPVEKCIMRRVFKCFIWRKPASEFACLLGIFPKLNRWANRGCFILAQVSLSLKAVVREEMGLATGLYPSYDLTRILTISISCFSFSLSLPFSLSSPRLTFCLV